MRIEKIAGKRGQRLLADFAERERFGAAEGWPIEKIAGKRGQRLLTDYAERERFGAAKGWPIENYSIPPISPIYCSPKLGELSQSD